MAVVVVGVMVGVDMSTILIMVECFSLPKIILASASGTIH
jgi:hypothetical protein